MLNTYERARVAQDKALKEGEGERKVFQDKLNNTEHDLDNATCENLKLKGLNFDLDYRVGYYSMVVEQLTRKVKLMGDKQGKMAKEVESSQASQDKELRRVAQEFELARKELDRMKKENLGKLDDLKRLHADNTKVQEAGYEEKVEDLERQLRDTDGVRKAYQQRLEFANVNWTCKLRLFVKDSDERAKQTTE